MQTEILPDTEIAAELIDAVRAFPLAREVSHCGTSFEVSPLAIYANCPLCGQAIKLRAFSGDVELADVFDAVLEWMNQPAARSVAENRQRELAADTELAPDALGTKLLRDGNR